MRCAPAQFRCFSSEPVSNDMLHKQLTKTITENDVVVFMKGTRKMPQCGFSRFVCVILQKEGVKKYKDVNVLADEQLRQYVKEFSDWPTIPQVYVKGQFLGGCDLMREMHEDGSLNHLLVREGIVGGQSDSENK